MPTYEFQCQDRHRTELKQGSSEPRPASVVCATCGKPARRLFSVPRIVVYMDFHDAENYYSSPEGQAEYG